MAWFGRRRGGYDNDRYYDGGYYEARRGGYRRGYGRPARGGSCLRDACLLDAGCCVGEWLDGNCLILAVFALPKLMLALRAPTTQEPVTEGAVAAMIVRAIRVYQREVSARRPGCCRMSPTCSHYAVQAVQRHGAVRGVALTLGRLLRCRPGGRRGHDPVPP
ncbi:MAG TPA: membrane protein insertion efficiency factor YidD [Pseudonocardia sp.]|jgi:hypothetical protein